MCEWKSYEYSLPRASAHLVSAHASELEKIPEPGEVWLFRNVELPRSLFCKLIENNLIRDKGEVKRGNTIVKQWETTPRLYENVQRYAS